MILSDFSIKQRVALDDKDAKKLYIDPFIEANVQPSSIDITLSSSFASIIKSRTTDGKTEVKNLSNRMDYKYLDVEKYVLYPKKFVLASSREFVRIPIDITATVEGRSSVGRTGLFVQNAGRIDPGFEGEITLELYNAGVNAIELKPGMRIAQLVFSEMTTPAEKPYSGKYNQQKGATGSLIFKDKELINGT